MSTQQPNSVSRGVQADPPIGPSPPPPPPPVGVADAAAEAVVQIVDDEQRYCWVCFATDADDALAAWVQPCRCSGTTKWVHQSCLQRWVDEKQKGNLLRRVNCPQCQTEYLIMFPAMGSIIGALEGFDTMIKRISPFLAAGVVVGSLYWTAVTFGAVTVLQVVGHTEGLEIMEKADPLVLLVGLPSIPVGLVLGRMVRWDDMILRFILNKNNNARKYPLLSIFLPVPEENINNPNETPDTPVISNSVSATRIFCGALLLPTFSTIVGRMFFDTVQNNVHRTLLGGLSFIVLKGIFKIYFKQKQFVRKRQRRILDYTEENIRIVSAMQSATNEPNNGGGPDGANGGIPANVNNAIPRPNNVPPGERIRRVHNV